MSTANLSAALSNFYFLVAIVVVFITGLGYARWTGNQGSAATIKLYKEQVEVQDRKIGEQKELIEALTRQVDTANGRLEEQARHIATLSSLVTGVPAWEKLMEGIGAIEQVTDRIGRLMEAMPTNWSDLERLHYTQTMEVHQEVIDRMERAQDRRAGA